MKNKKLLPALVAGFFIPAATATAAVRPLPLPCPGGFPDGESTVTHPLGGWNDETAFAILTLSTVASPTGGVEVAFGIDRNADGDLAPEETELRVGCDCGEWFVRNERTERTVLADPACHVGTVPKITSFSTAYSSVIPPYPNVFVWNGSSEGWLQFEFPTFREKWEAEVRFCASGLQAARCRFP